MGTSSENPVIIGASSSSSPKDKTVLGEFQGILAWPQPPATDPHPYITSPSYKSQQQSQPGTRISAETGPASDILRSPDPHQQVANLLLMVAWT